MKVTQLGGRITQYRNAAQLTQDQLATKANVSRAIISKLECGARNGGSLTIVQAIANALGVKLVDLLPDGFEGADAGKGPPPQIAPATVGKAPPTEGASQAPPPQIAPATVGKAPPTEGASQAANG